MSKLKILLVEDSDEDLENYHGTAKVYQLKNKRVLETIEVKTKENAISILDNSYDGAIIDLKLAGGVDEGNDVIEEIQKKYRIPVAVMTGTPDNFRADSSIIKAYKKGENGYDEILDDLFLIYQTGLTKIMGGRGVIETAMNKIFWKNILPKFDSWKNHNRKGENTEGALLRFVISHIYEVMDNDIANYFPEEMYIHPPISENISTGSIVKQKGTDDYHIILSPACDLALHDGSIKTDRILLCAIEKLNNDIIKKAVKNLKNADEGKRARANDIVNKIPRNVYSNYYHYLPKVDYFEGGIVNFRKINTLKPKEFTEKFDSPELQIASPFIKDIVSRFSSYYARQGQPDFDFDKMVPDLIEAGQ